MDKIKTKLREKLNKNDKIIVYHGTLKKFIKPIETDGLKHTNYSDPNWFMVSTDFESALFHATPIEGGEVYIIEFQVPIINEKWFGYPYFWPPFERNEKSKWFALKQPLSNNLITKVHNIPYSQFLKQKKIGF